MIRNSIAKNTTFVYFSTTSIFDPTRQASAYIQHKQQVEKFLKENVKSYLLVRLPILVGQSENPHTLINFLVNAIQDQRTINLHANACRNLLAIDDLVPLLSPFLVPYIVKNVINILGSKSISIPDLIHTLESILHTKGSYIWQNTGACFEIPADQGVIIYKEEENYITSTLKKYILPVKNNDL